jgi:nicotinate phosphoribosyltransferase
VDSFGVGERLITSRSEPVFGGVYKLVAIEEANEIIPKIKISENVGKIINPGNKQVWRLFDRSSGKSIADVLTLDNEAIDESKPYELFDPEYTWKKKTVTNFYAKKLLTKIFDKGTCVYESPALNDIKAYCADQADTLWDEVKRFENPHRYYVDLSKPLWELKERLLQEYSVK